MAQLSLTQRLRQNPGLLARYRRDPGLRSKLPDQLLTSAQRAMRQGNATNAAIGNPLASLTGTTLQKLAHTVTESDYAPAYTDLSRQQAQTGAQAAELARRAAAYYAQANTQNDQATGAAAQSGTALDDRLKQIGQDAASRIGQAQQEGTQRIQQDAQLRGPGLEGDSTRQLAERMAAAQSQAASGNATTRGDAAQRSFDAEAFARNLGGAGRLRGGETQGDITRRAQGQFGDILTARTKLDQQKIGDYTKTLLGMRDKQAETELAKATLLGNQSTDAAKLQADARKTNQYGYTTGEWAGMTPADRQAAIKRFKGYGKTGPDRGKVNQYGITDKDWRAMSTADRQKVIRDFKAKGKGKAPGGADWGTPAQQGTAGDEIGNALTYANQLKGVKVKGKPASRAQVAQYLIQGQKSRKKADGTYSSEIPKFDQLWTSVALDVAYDGHVSRANIRKLHARGIKVGPLGYPINPPGASGYDKGQQPG